MIDNNSNLNEIKSFVDDFLLNHQNGIKTIYNIFFKNDKFISFDSLNKELKEELKNGCIVYLKNNRSVSEIDNYLFYIANSFCKKKAMFLVKNSEYICPGCLFFGKITILNYDKILKCNVCNSKLEIDPKLIKYYLTFSKHFKHGYRCLDCNRFIPHPLDNSSKVFCPYLDCSFVGLCKDLKKMHHPKVQMPIQPILLDNNQSNILEEKSSLIGNLSQIKDVIISQINNVAYNSSNFTIQHKNLAYQAILNILEKYPNDMINYLLYKSRSGGFQSKIFQEYIYLLEKSLPFRFKKGKKYFTINSLLDPNIKIFDGISIFENEVNKNFCVKNNTKEFYIGGRKASIAQKFYIGKLLDIIDFNTRKSIIENVIEYSFSGIKLKNINPGTKVIVSHLRVPPHYQMGGMSYINRARKQIVDQLESK